MNDFRLSPISPGRSARLRRAVSVSAFAVATVLASCDGDNNSTSAVSVTSAVPHTTSGTLVFGRWVGGSNLELLTVPADGGTESKLPLPAGDTRPEAPSWSPDGRTLGLVAENDQKLVFFGTANPDGSDYVQFESPDPGLQLGCASWSPDGQRVACEGWSDDDPSKNGVYTVQSSDGQQLVRVTTSPNRLHDAPCGYSPDGKQIMFVRTSQSDQEHNALMIVDGDGTGERSLTDQRVGLSCSWSPDGKSALTDVDGSLVVISVADGTVNPIPLDVATGSYASRASWSPDGTRIVFSMKLPSKATDIYTARADGTNVVQITNTPGIDEEFAGWSPLP